MDKIEEKELIKKIIDFTPYVIIATADKAGKPWNSPVTAAITEDFVVYWSSLLDAQHSKNIAGNPQVFAVVCNVEIKRALYIQATASIATDVEEITLANKLIHDRISQKPSSSSYLDSEPKRIYKATPTKVWRNEMGMKDGVFKDWKIEITLVG